MSKTSKKYLPSKSKFYEYDFKAEQNLPLEQLDRDKVQLTNRNSNGNFDEIVDIEHQDSRNQSSMRNSMDFLHNDMDQSFGSFHQHNQNHIPLQDNIQEKRLRILRTWLLFIIVAFILELSALEIPSISMMNQHTQIIVGLMVGIIALNVLLMIYAFKRDINAIFFISLTTQISFVLCNLKTSHHDGQSPNYIVVKQACSGRLILMALETSHLTSMAVQSHWIKYVVVNLINLIMFSFIIFSNFDSKQASFWELGQVGSIFGSAVVSLIIYHYMMEQLLKANETEIKVQSEKKESYEQVINIINEGIIVVQEARVHFVNGLMNAIFSKVMNVENFAEVIEMQSIIEKMDLIDQPLFKASPIENLSFLISSQESDNYTNQQSHENSVHTEQKIHSLREIFLMSKDTLEELKFSFSVDYYPRFKQELKEVINVYSNDLVAIPTFQDFMISKTPLQNVGQIDSVYPSFILQFRDLSMKFKANSQEQVSNKIYRFVNKLVGEKVNGPLSCLQNQCKIFQIMLDKTTESIQSLKNDISRKKYSQIIKFLDFTKQTNQINKVQSNKLKMNIEDLVCFTQIKHQNFVCNNYRFDLKSMLNELIDNFIYHSKSNEISITSHFFGFPQKQKEFSGTLYNYQIQDYDKHFFSVNSDKLRVQQILFRLLTNALKYTPKYGSVFILCQYVPASSVKQEEAGNNDLTDKFINLHHPRSKAQDKLVIAQKEMGDPVFKDVRERIIFSVINTGVGVSEKVSNHLVQIFKTSDQDSFKNKSSCPGLEIMSDIVKQLNGFVSFKTMSNVGTSFSFSIPLKFPIVKTMKAYEQEQKLNFDGKVQFSCELDNDLTTDDDNTAFKKYQMLNRAQTHKMLNSNIGSSVQKKLQTKRDEEQEQDIEDEEMQLESIRVPEDELRDMILLVKDDSQMLDQMKFFIQQLNYPNVEQRVTLCRNGEQALQLFQDKRNWSKYKLIITDCNLSIINGMEMTQKIRELLSEVGLPQIDHPQFYGISYLNDRQTIERAKQCGMKNVLPDPISINHLGQLLMNQRLIDYIPEYLQNLS